MKSRGRLVTTAEMRALDRWAINSLCIPAVCLMENAGRLVAEKVQKILEQRRGRRATIVCGPGNNGGDGFVAARYLRNAGFSISVLLTSDLRRMTPESAINFQIIKKLKIPVSNALKLPSRSLKNELARAEVIVDAIFGVGLSRDVGSEYRALIEAVNDSGRPVVAIDIPSGLDGTTGRIWGVAVKAHTTVTLACAKKGLSRGDGPHLSGRIVCADIGIPMRQCHADQ